MDQEDIDRLDRISAHLHALLNNRQPPPLDLSAQKNDEIRQVGQFVNQLTEVLTHLTRATLHLSQGDIDTPIPSGLPACHNLKNLQATLRHLAWQTGQVAQGDFSQRVDFLGGFSTSFNTMVEQLEANQQRILAQNSELARLAATDPLTGVFNRRSFMEAGQRELVRSRRHARLFSVIQLDIDHFKKINDSHGHAVGDRVLQAFAAKCLEELRENDVFGRLGGEKFALLLPETDLAGAGVVAERFREAVAGLVVKDEGREVRFTISLGVASLQEQDTALEDLLRRADEALYLAKNSGRNRVMVAQ